MVPSLSTSASGSRTMRRRHQSAKSFLAITFCTTHRCTVLYDFCVLVVWFDALLLKNQGTGAISGSDWLLQMIWRSFWFYAQILYSIRILYLRIVNIKHHEKDIGMWLPKDRKMLLHKLGRLVFLIPVAVILLADVMPMKNPTIINASFLKKCQLTPSYRLGLQDIFEIGRKYLVFLSAATFELRLER
jgi:hypothetical protein